MDDQRFDRLARSLGQRLTRRQSMVALAGAASAAALAGREASAGVVGCSLTCPWYPSVTTIEGTCEVNMTVPAPEASVECGPTPDIQCTPASGDFATGLYTVTCVIPETTAQCSYDLYVYDGNPSEYVCPADITMTVEGPTSVEFGSPSYGTICGDFGYPYNCDYNSGDVFPIGTTTVTCDIDYSQAGKGPDPCSFDITLNQVALTATPTEVPATTEPTTEPTVGPTDVPATEIPTAVDPTTVPGDPTATPAPVTELPNTGAGNDGSGAGKLLPIAIVGAGAAVLARLGVRKRESITDPIE